MLSSPTHPRVGLLNIQLSRALDFSGDRAGAKAAARRAVAISLSTLGDEHSQTATAYQALANVMFREDDFAQSREYLERAIDVMRRVYGPESHQVGGMLSSLGLSVSQLGEYAASTRNHEEAVRILSMTVGPRHPTTAGAIGRMGANYRAQGDCRAAIRSCRLAMEILEESDPEHARILDQIRCMAGCMVDLGQYREAVSSLRRGLALSERRDEPALYRARLELLTARTLWETGERAEARTHAEAAKARLEATGRHEAFRATVAAWLDAHPPT